MIRVTFLQQRDLSAKLTQTLEANRQKLRFCPFETQRFAISAALHFLFKTLLRHKRYNIPVLLFERAEYLVTRIAKRCEFEKRVEGWC